MNDASSTPPVSRDVRQVFGGVAMAFAMGMITYLIGWGSPSNSLHTSALSWCFTIIGGVLIAFGFPAIVQLYQAISGK